jgi:hypothetical protein
VAGYASTGPTQTFFFAELRCESGQVFRAILDLPLVFERKQPMLDSMDPLPCYRRLSSSAPEGDLKSALVKAGPGDADAQFGLSSRYHRASMERLETDSAESRIEAYKWFHLASARGYKGSDAAGERLALGITREQVADGNRRTTAFVARKPATLLHDSSRTTTE